MAIRANGKDAVAADRLPPPGRQRPGHLPASSSGAGRRRARSAPPGIEIVPVYDQGLLVRTAIANVRDAILIGGAVQRAHPAAVPQEPPRHADRRALDPLEPDHQLRVPAT